jgi:hypothetical protein
MKPVRRFLPALLLPLAALTACDLTEVTLTRPEDVILVEAVLRAGDTIQTAWLHRTLGTNGGGPIADASLIVREAATGTAMRFDMVEDSLCMTPAEPSRPGSGACYAARGAPDMVKPGTRYTLELRVPDGRRLAGTTTVPATFELVRPARASCTLTPGTSLELTWTGAAGTSVYIGETRLTGLAAALRQAGVPVNAPDGAIDLLALAIGATDTTMAFPGDFGLFDRFDPELFELLLAIRDGLPPGVAADIAIAAADRNYVNWVRGGVFNPSGVVRVPSVQGDGTGVFGSLVIRRTSLRTHGSGPPCD